MYQVKHAVYAPGVDGLKQGRTAVKHLGPDLFVPQRRQNSPASIKRNLPLGAVAADQKTHVAKAFRVVGFHGRNLVHAASSFSKPDSRNCPAIFPILPAPKNSTRSSSFKIAGRAVVNSSTSAINTGFTLPRARMELQSAALSVPSILF